MKNMAGCVLLQVCVFIFAQTAQGGDLILNYDKPAADWESEAMPIGNGSMGAMIFGGVESERIQFNHDTLWTGDSEVRGEYQPFGDIHVLLSDKPFVLPQFLDLRYGQFANNYSNAADGDLATNWTARFDRKEKLLVWEAGFASRRVLNSYSIVSPQKMRKDSMPRQWKFQASNDRAHWKTLDEQKNTNFWAEKSQEKKFRFENNEAFRFYRLAFELEKGFDEKKGQAKYPQLEIAEIRFGDSNEGVGFSDYSRVLNLSDATAKVSYRKGGVNYSREYFASYPNKIVVAKFSADKKGAYTGAIMLQDSHGAASRVDGERIVFSSVLKNKKNPVAYEAQLEIQIEGGAVKSQDGMLSFENADSLTLFLSAGTDYLPAFDKNWKGAHPHESLSARLKKASALGYDELKRIHVADYKNLFDRADFRLKNAGPDKRTIPARLAAYKNGAKDAYLEELMFHMGRYLLIASSRQGTLPANLQGVWNNRITPIWGSDYHFNINIQMTYWPALLTNLPELHMQYVDYINSQIPAYRKMLKNAFDSGLKTQSGKQRWNTLPRGWTLRTNGNIYGASGYRWNETGNAWNMWHFWDQYDFTRDKGYLKNVAYPAMMEVVEYWEDRLAKRQDGKLVVPDGWSPEHGPEEDGVTYDQMLVWGLFNDFIQASETLQVDSEYREKIRAMRDNLLAPKVGSWGQLQEWADDKDDKDDTHRHYSHLIGLHPGRQITSNTPELLAAAEITLNAKEDAMKKHPKYPTFWLMTGWSKAWRMSMWARLHKPERAYAMLREIIDYRLLDNFFTLCPPFVIDANCGATAGIAECLLQSHEGVIEILPALPAEWPDGYAKGLRARGAFEVDIEWTGGKLSGGKIKSHSVGNIIVRYNGKDRAVQFAEGETLKLSEVFN